MRSADRYSSNNDVNDIFNEGDNCDEDENKNEIKND